MQDEAFVHHFESEEEKKEEEESEEEEKKEKVVKVHSSGEIHVCLHQTAFKSKYQETNNYQ